jgi:hypothetical protein
MAAVGGSVLECSLRGRLLIPTADCDVKLKLGGSSNDRESNGNSTGRLIKTSEAGSVEGLAIEIDHDRDDLSFLQEVCDGTEFVDFSITLASGHTYQGKVQLQELPPLSTKSTTAELKLVADGKFSLQ